MSLCLLKSQGNARLHHAAGRRTPRYLLAPEVAVLQSYLPDLTQRMYFDTLWNSGARPGEGMALRPVDLILEPTRQHPQPVAIVKTLKQREREASRPPGRSRKETISPPRSRHDPFTDSTQHTFRHSYVIHLLMNIDR